MICTCRWLRIQAWIVVWRHGTTLHWLLKQAPLIQLTWISMLRLIVLYSTWWRLRFWTSCFLFQLISKILIAVDWHRIKDRVPSNALLGSWFHLMLLCCPLFFFTWWAATDIRTNNCVVIINLTFPFITLLMVLQWREVVILPLTLRFNLFKDHSLVWRGGTPTILLVVWLVPYALLQCRYWTVILYAAPWG